jgi:hypothetical protein
LVSGKKQNGGCSRGHRQVVATSAVPDGAVATPRSPGSLARRRPRKDGEGCTRLVATPRSPGSLARRNQARIRYGERITDRVRSQHLLVGITGETGAGSSGRRWHLAGGRNTCSSGSLARQRVQRAAPYQTPALSQHLQTRRSMSQRLLVGKSGETLRSCERRTARVVATPARREGRRERSQRLRSLQSQHLLVGNGERRRDK